MVKPTICVDFDGVLHSYDSGWCGATKIPDAPVSGSVAWIEELIEAGLNVVVCSPRANSERGSSAIKAWLHEHGFPVAEMTITAEKVPALMYIDDRAYRFTGTNFPSAHTVWDMKPWMQDQNV